MKPENSLIWHREVLGWINKYSGAQDDSDLANEMGRVVAS